MRLKRAILEELEVRLVEPFVTSFGAERRRRVLFVTLEERGGETGTGECAAATDPLYSMETVGSARDVIERSFLPALARLDAPTPSTLENALGRFKGHRMARGALDVALRDLEARLAGRSLSRSIGGTLPRVAVGVSIGIQPTLPALVRVAQGYDAAGYARLKLKVRPGWDASAAGAVRRALPDARMWVDANQAYPVSASSALRRWASRWRVEQVEQPFNERALGAHALLAAGAPFRVCLDESVVDRASLDEAIDRRALTALNVKPGRVGGLGAGVRLARGAVAAGIPVWVGGMLETGIGRAAAVALASRAEFTLPADLSASDRYYTDDLIDPPFTLGPGSTLEVTRGPGLGVTVDEGRWRRALRRRRVVPL